MDDVTGNKGYQNELLVEMPEFNVNLEIWREPGGNRVAKAYVSRSGFHTMAILKVNDIRTSQFQQPVTDESDLKIFIEKVHQALVAGSAEARAEYAGFMASRFAGIRRQGEIAAASGADRKDNPYGGNEGEVWSKGYDDFKKPN